MNQRIHLQQLVFLVFVLAVLGALGFMTMRLRAPLSLPQAPLTEPERLPATSSESFDYEQAADNLAFRWQAMAGYYEQHGMLTRENFDYEQAADNLVFRWQAMAKFYEKNGLLTRDAIPISAAVAGYAERLNAGDLEGALAYFDDNAIFYMLGLPPQGFEMLSGKEQISGMFAENIASHFKMEVEVLSVVDDVVTARVTTWHDFTREIGAAPVEATSIYLVKDGKIVSESWHVSEESVARLKAALAGMMLAEPEAEAAAVSPVSAVKVVFAGGTCAYDGPLALQAGPVAVTLDVQDRDKGKYAFSAFTLEPDKGFADLMASTIGLPPSWADPLYLEEVPPGANRRLEFTVKKGPVYIVCWSSPPDLAIGAIGPFNVAE